MSSSTCSGGAVVTRVSISCGGFETDHMERLCWNNCKSGKTSEAMNTTQPPSIIKVAIVEDRREIRDGLAMLISGTEGFECTGTYRSMEDALARISGSLPDVVLCDIGLPGMSGIEGIRILKERHPDLQLLMLTVYDDDERIFDALVRRCQRLPT